MVFTSYIVFNRFGGVRLRLAKAALFTALQRRSRLCVSPCAGVQHAARIMRLRVVRRDSWFKGRLAIGSDSVHRELSFEEEANRMRSNVCKQMFLGNLCWFSSGLRPVRALCLCPSSSMLVPFPVLQAVNLLPEVASEQRLQRCRGRKELALRVRGSPRSLGSQQKCGARRERQSPVRDCCYE